MDLVEMAREYETLVGERDRIVARLEEIRLQVGEVFGLKKMPSRVKYGSGSRRLVEVVERLGRASQADIERELGCTASSARQMLYTETKNGRIQRLERGVYGPIEVMP